MPVRQFTGKAAPLTIGDERDWIEDTAQLPYYHYILD